MAHPTAVLSRLRVRVGYPLTLIYLWLAKPTANAIAIGAAVGIVGLVIRGRAAGHLRKSEALATSGPYAMTRNPLYLGSATLAAGFAIASHSWIASLLLLAYFLVFYPAVMKSEEAELHALYVKEFESYAARVPLFWPRILRRGEAGGARFSWALYRRNREYRAAFGFAFALGLVVLRMFWRG